MRLKTPNRTTTYYIPHDSLIQRDPQKRIAPKDAPETNGFGYLTACRPSMGPWRDYELSEPGTPVVRYGCDHPDHIRHFVYIVHEGADVYSLDITEWGEWATDIPELDATLRKAGLL